MTFQKSKAKGTQKATEQASPQASSLVPPSKEPDEKQDPLLVVGYDMSLGLLGIAASRGHEVARGDCFDMSCWRPGSFVSRGAATCICARSTDMLILRTMPYQ